MARKRTAPLTLEELGQDRSLYFERCLRIITKNAADPVPLVLKPEQKRLFSLIDNERAQGRAPKIIVLKSRQVGASTASEAELFRMCHTHKNRSSLVLACDDDSVERIFKMSKRFYDELPPSVKPPTKYSTKKLIDFAHNNSRMQVVLAGGRGMTAQYVHISELAFVKDADTMMAALLQTVPDHPDTLIIAESTPNGIGNYFHNLWVNAVAGRNSWVPFFSPWFEEVAYQSTPWFEESDLSEHDRNLMQEHGLSLRQMAWYINTREDKLNGDQRLMDQEYGSDPKSCFLASGRSVFDMGLPRYQDEYEAAKDAGELPPQVELEADRDVKHGINIRVVQGGRWRIYRPPVARHQYVTGWDIASGEPGGDYTPGVVLDRMTMDIDAVFYARLPPDQLAVMAAMVSWWYNRAKIAGEANNHGILFFDELTRRVQYPHIHYRMVNEESVARQVSEKPGILTTGKTREGLLNLPRRYVREHAGRCLDPDLLKEFSEAFYDRTPSGEDRADHPKGGYLDGTMALALALYSHLGDAEAQLAPLPLEVTNKALAVYHENQVRRSMGIPEEDIDIGQLTIDEIVRLDEAHERREKAELRDGLGGYR